MREGGVGLARQHVWSKVVCLRLWRSGEIFSY